MALRVILEGTPASFPVQALNPSAPIYWEAGAIGMLDNTGHGLVSDGTAALGLLADRRSTSVGIANQTFLASNPGQYGDESLFNQPNINNGLYGPGAVIPQNTIPTTTLLRDETAQNPNADSRYVTMYIRGGIYGTDQFDTAQTYVPGTTLYVDTDGSGRLTNQIRTVAVGTVLLPVDGNNVLQFKLNLI